MKKIVLAIPIFLLSGCYSSPEEEIDTTTRTVVGNDSATYIKVSVDSTWTDTLNYTF